MAQSLPAADAARAKHLQKQYIAQQARAEEEAERRFDLGEGEQKRVEQVASMVIRDRLVAPAVAAFVVFEGPAGEPEVGLRYGKETAIHKIHRHALGQIAGKVNVPIAFVNTLNPRKKDEVWRTGLLAHNFTTLFRETPWGLDKNGEPTRFLHRIVGTELRGFLSRRYNRHLASAPLLRAFVEAAKMVSARPIEAITSDVRLALKCYLPHVFEAYPGQYICVGVEWSNSDFGAGRLQLAQTLWDPLRNIRSVLDEAISRVHLGSIIEDSDIEMSDETAVAEVEAQAKAIRDAVTEMLSERAVKRLLEAIRVANEQEISWTKLKGQLAKFLYKKDIEDIERLLNDDTGIIDLPPPGRNTEGKAIPTKWWAATLVSTMASKVKDEDRKLELQHEAGRLLSGLMQKEDPQ